jgi:hypothetical protein
MAALFPNFVNRDQNMALIREITMIKLEGVTDYFQKGKILGPNGWNIELHKGFFEWVGIFAGYGGI